MNSPKYLFLIIMVLVSSCASYKPQYKNKTRAVHPKNSKEVAHAFYLLGDGGNSPIGTETTTLKRLRTALNTANQESTLLFLGDNIYPAGMPKKDTLKGLLLNIN